MRTMPSRTLLMLLVSVVLAACADSASAQQEHDHHSAYAGQGSEIASLSPKEIAQYKNGEGMGLARPAELNRYPGPKHVLEASAALGLSEKQKADSKKIFDEMKNEAIRVGLEIIEKERALSRRFEHRHIDDEILRDLTSEIGLLQGTLRRIHLEAHLRMAELLSEQQIAKYDELRGYAKASH